MDGTSKTLADRDDNGDDPGNGNGDSDNGSDDGDDSSSTTDNDSHFVENETRGVLLYYQPIDTAQRRHPTGAATAIQSARHSGCGTRAESCLKRLAAVTPTRCARRRL